MAALQNRSSTAQANVIPCVDGANSPNIAPADSKSIDSLLAFWHSNGSDRQFTTYSAISAHAGSPMPGDHVLFMGMAWTPEFSLMFKNLRDQGIPYSILGFDIIPLQRPNIVGDAYHYLFLAWLTDILNSAHTIFVSCGLTRRLFKSLERWQSG